jgi:hypothetical protein
MSPEERAKTEFALLACNDTCDAAQSSQKKASKAKVTKTKAEPMRQGRAKTGASSGMRNKRARSSGAKQSAPKRKKTAPKRKKTAPKRKKTAPKKRQ